jgi:hypothetical protein
MTERSNCAARARALDLGRIELALAAFAAEH